MKSVYWTAALGLIVMGGVAIAASAGGEELMPAGEMTRAQAMALAARHFDRMDVNKDGKVDAGDREAMHGRMADEMFARLDSDHNDAISRDEFRAGAARLATAHRPGMRFARADMDGDGTLTLKDFEQRAGAHFDRADVNHDGKLSGDERKAAHDQMRNRPGR